jgi:hypothetical protein
VVAREDKIVDRREKGVSAMSVGASLIPLISLFLDLHPISPLVNHHQFFT